MTLEGSDKKLLKLRKEMRIRLRNDKITCKIEKEIEEVKPKKEVKTQIEKIDPKKVVTRKKRTTKNKK